MVLVKEEELEVEPWRWIKSRKVWRGDGGANGLYPPMAAKKIVVEELMAEVEEWMA
ncbi:hypothetical protein YC2023_050651 [Brassica napus]